MGPTDATSSKIRMILYSSEEGLHNKSRVRRGCSTLFLPRFLQPPLASCPVWLWHSDSCSVPGFVFSLRLASNCRVWGSSTPGSSWVQVSFSRLGFLFSQVNSSACLLRFCIVQTSICRDTSPWDLLTCKLEIKAFFKMSSRTQACFIIN